MRRASGALTTVAGWLPESVMPVGARVRRHGVLATAPATLAIIVASTLATASLRLAEPIAQGGRAVFVYRGRDFFDGALWRLPASALLAQSWWQWAATCGILALAGAALEVRIGSGRLIGCLALCHCLPTIVVALQARVVDSNVLARPDYGMSCMMVGAVAALAGRIRSLPLALVLALSLAGDPLFNSPVTNAEHLMAVAIGATLGLLASREDRPSAAPARRAAKREPRVVVAVGLGWLVAQVQPPSADEPAGAA